MIAATSRRDEAFEVVCRLHRTPENLESNKAREELLLMEKQFELDELLNMRPFEIFRTAPNRRRALVSTLMM